MAIKDLNFGELVFKYETTENQVEHLSVNDPKMAENCERSDTLLTHADVKELQQFLNEVEHRMRPFVAGKR